MPESGAVEHQIQVIPGKEQTRRRKFPRYGIEYSWILENRRPIRPDTLELRGGRPLSIRVGRGQTRRRRHYGDRCGKRGSRRVGQRKLRGSGWDVTRQYNRDLP